MDGLKARPDSLLVRSKALTFAAEGPLADSVEVRLPSVAAVLGCVVPAMRRRALARAFARAERAFDRGDLAAVVALLADDVYYVPPPPLHDGPPIVGRNAVIRFCLTRFELAARSGLRRLRVGEDHDPVLQDGCGGQVQARGRAVAVEQSLRSAAADEEGVDPEPQLVHEPGRQQLMGEVAEPVLDDVAAVLGL
ncbi:MAG: nuclear transport factor 2 family protein [Solirubrobacterales bacterium]|nr:nuclear transport factor 2 family protein [Solirubrobacterales bacterium]